MLTVRNVYTKSIVSEACQLMNNPNHPVLLSEHFSKSLINSKRFHHNFTKSHYSDNRNNFVYSVPSIWNASGSGYYLTSIRNPEIMVDGGFSVTHLINYS